MMLAEQAQPATEQLPERIRRAALDRKIDPKDFDAKIKKQGDSYVYCTDSSCETLGPVRLPNTGPWSDVKDLEVVPAPIKEALFKHVKETGTKIHFVEIQEANDGKLLWVAKDVKGVQITLGDATALPPILAEKVKPEYAPSLGAPTPAVAPPNPSTEPTPKPEPKVVTPTEITGLRSGDVLAITDFPISRYSVTGPGSYSLDKVGSFTLQKDGTFTFKVFPTFKGTVALAKPYEELGANIWEGTLSKQYVEAIEAWRAANPAKPAVFFLSSSDCDPCRIHLGTVREALKDGNLQVFIVKNSTFRNAYSDYGISAGVPATVVLEPNTPLVARQGEPKNEPLIKRLGLRDPQSGVMMREKLLDFLKAKLPNFGILRPLE